MKFEAAKRNEQKPGSFFALCEKLDEMAENDEIQHVVFDLSAPDFRMNLAQLSELNRHVQKLRAAKKQTFAWLDKAYDEHHPDMIELTTEPCFDSVRSDPRFKQLLSRVGFLNATPRSLSCNSRHDGKK